VHSHDILAMAAAIVPERDATVFDGARQTYAELAARANRLANALAGLGVGPGDRVAVVDVNTPAHLEVYFAVARLRAIYVPMNFRGRGAELVYPLEVAAPKVLFAGERYVSRIDSLPLALQESAFVAFARSGDDSEENGWSAYEALLAGGDQEELRFPEGDDDATAALLFTAGTTGNPKAVPLSHSSFTSFMLSSIEPADPDAEECTLLTLPMYHIAGLQSALAGVYGGRTLVVQRQFEAREWMELVQRERVQRALLVPTMLKQIIDHPDFPCHDLSSLAVLTYGGAPMPFTVVERAIEALPGVQFINAFGQTETGSTIAMVPPEDHVLEGPTDVLATRRKHLASIGVALPDVEVRIVDEDGREVGAGEPGEIIARGPRLMRGYWGDDAASASTIRKGWLYTGDLGHMDEDGYIYLGGRAKDFIKRGGEMVSPEEVESVLYAHPGVEECAVIGLPDETWGERVVAVVVPKAGEGAATEDALLEMVQERLARFKRPEQVVFVDALPRNDLGKVLKRELRERLGG
jgi:acyl-CoA synthetase (AMP-forming)/AMP-acid ligase II